MAYQNDDLLAFRQLRAQAARKKQLETQRAALTDRCQVLSVQAEACRKARQAAEQEVATLESKGPMGLLYTIAGDKAKRLDAARQTLRKARADDQQASWDLAQAQVDLAQTERSLEPLASCDSAFAAARQAAVEALRPGSALAALLDQPNNNLAVEYCKAILELDVPLTPIPLPRQGANHGEALNGNVQFASASALRALWTQQGVEALRPYVPEAVFPLYQEAAAAGSSTDFSAAGRCELALLRARCTGETPFANVRGVSEGLEHRLEKAVRASTTLDELLNTLTTIRYPRARMRRLAMDAALGYTEEAFPALPPYLHLLGARRELLGQLKQAALPASHSLMRLQEENAACARMVQAQLTASDFAALCRAKPRPMGGALRQKIIFLTI